MARIRTIKPEFFRSRKLSECSVRTRLTFIGLWTACDDEGRYQYEPELLKADLWPFEADVTTEDVGADVWELAKRALVCLYEAAGKRYLHVTNWREHQKINRPTPSRLPECSRNPHGGFPEDSSPRARAQEVEVEREKEREQGTVPPSAGRASRSTADATITPIPTAQTFVAAYVDAYRGRAGHDPPSRVKGQLAKELGRLIGDGIPTDRIKAGFVDWFEADQHPATLASFVEANGRGGRPRTRQQAHRDQRARTSQALAAWASEEGGEHGPDGLGLHGGAPPRGLPAPAD